MFKIKIKINEEKKKIVVTTFEGGEKCKEVFRLKDYNPDSSFYCYRSRLEDVGYGIDNHIESTLEEWYNEIKGEKNV